jgi:hypothetical protein
MNTIEIFEKIETLYETFKTEHSGKTKASQRRARKALGEIKKLMSEYRKVSVSESKS